MDFSDATKITILFSFKNPETGSFLLLFFQILINKIHVHTWQVHQFCQHAFLIQVKNLKQDISALLVVGAV